MTGDGSLNVSEFPTGKRGCLGDKTRRLRLQPAGLRHSQLLSSRGPCSKEISARATYRGLAPDLLRCRYDFDVGGNGVFRLFPSGDNRYYKGNEVLNSYGRRPNDNLLLEYGFAMLDNEWDEVQLAFSLLSGGALYEEKRAILRASAQYTCR